MAILYKATATSTGGRDGAVRSADGVLDLSLAVPKELGGPGGAKSNPEELFAAGYAACFHSALKLIAGKQKLSIHDSTVMATVGIGPTDAGGFTLEVDLTVALPGLQAAQAQELVRTAHGVPLLKCDPEQHSGSSYRHNRRRRAGRPRLNENAKRLLHRERTRRATHHRAAPVG